MKINDTKLKEWADLKEPGDYKKIADLLDTAPPNVTKIFKDKEATITQVSIINLFYKNRKKEVAKLLK